jgi:hypothetical protein
MSYSHNFSLLLHAGLETILEQSYGLAAVFEYAINLTGLLRGVHQYTIQARNYSHLVLNNTSLYSCMINHRARTMGNLVASHVTA